MTALPAATEFTGSSITEAEFKTAITNLRDFLSGLLGTDGDAATALATLDAIFAAGIGSKAAAFTITSADRGKLHVCSGTWTMTLPAVASVEQGFAFAVRNNSSGVITLDPDGAELIDGSATLALGETETAVIVNTGAKWVTVGRSVPVSYPISVANGGTGSGATPTASNSPQADAIKAVKHDQGYNTVGSYCFASIGSSGDTAGAQAAGATISGSYLYAAYIQKQDTSWTIKCNIGGTLSGTWRILCAVPSGVGDLRFRITLFQRIA